MLWRLYRRRVRFNPTLGAGTHKQIVEAEVGGMYGGCGTWPLYVGDSVINSYEEEVDRNNSGLQWLQQTHPATFAGVLTNHQCDSAVLPVPAPFLWWRLEQRVLAQWVALSGMVSEAQLFDEAVEEQWGISNATARQAVRRLATQAMRVCMECMDRVRLAGSTCGVCATCLPFFACGAALSDPFCCLSTTPMSFLI